MGTKIEFMYLIPGNWFELKNLIAAKTYPYDIGTFKTEILSQVNSRAEKLSFINNSIGVRYTNAKIIDITFYLDNNKFNSMANILSLEKRHPVITFHGTSSFDTVKSILEHGYIIPGITNIKTGIMVHKAHGSIYGIGVYSSPFFDKANCYTTPDKDGYVYILINIVFLGIARLVSNGMQDIDHKAPINGKYSDGINTRLSKNIMFLRGFSHYVRKFLLSKNVRKYM